MKIFKLITTITQVLLVALICISLFLVILSRNNGFVGLYAYVIGSGSMGKTIPVNSLIIVKPQSEYKKDDIVTFYTNDNNGVRQKTPTTHRITEVISGENPGIKTKGDANDTPDLSVTSSKNIVGRVLFHLPYFGKFTKFAESRNGLIFLIVIPGTILFYTELNSLTAEIKKAIERKKKKSENLQEKADQVVDLPKKKSVKPRRTLTTMVFLLLLFKLSSSSTVQAAYLDSEDVSGNQIDTGVVDMVVTSDTDDINGLTPSNPVVVNYSINPTTSTGFKYELFDFEMSESRPDFCSQVNVQIRLNGNTEYMGRLVDLDAYTTPNFATSGSVSQNLEFTYQLASSTSAEFEGQTCQFYIMFFAHQTDNDGTWGFLDEESVVHTLSSADWTGPFTQIISPLEGDAVSDNFDIFGSVIDSNPHHYWLVVQNSAGVTVAGPGTVPQPASIENQQLASIDISSLPDGQYTIKLEARDANGNKVPNLSPVPADPEVSGDSVDWISITISRPIAPVSPLSMSLVLEPTIEPTPTVTPTPTPTNTPAPASSLTVVLTKPEENNIHLAISNIPDTFGDNPSDNISYEMLYNNDSPENTKGVQASFSSTSGQTTYSTDIYLGTCSSTCTPDVITSNQYIIKVTANIDGQETVIEETFTL